MTDPVTDPLPTISVLATNSIEEGQTEVVATITPGTVGDLLTLT